MQNISVFLASSSSRVLAVSDGILYHWVAGEAPQRLSVPASPNDFLEAARIKWGLVPVVGADGQPAPSVPTEAFPQLVVREQDGDVVYQIAEAPAAPGKSPTNRLKRFVKKSTPDDYVLAAIAEVGQGQNKFTSILKLGQHLGFPPSALHTILLRLWQAGKINVAPAEGRFGSTEAERLWWLRAHGEAFGYVMLRG